MATRTPTIKALWNAVTKGGQASLEMAKQAIHHWETHDGALEKAQQVLELSKERPLYHKAFVTVLTACLPIDKNGSRVKLTDKGQTKRAESRDGFHAAFASAEFGSILEMVGGKKKAPSNKTTYAKAQGMVNTIKQMLSGEEVTGSSEELITLLAQLKDVQSLAMKLREAELALGVEGLSDSASAEAPAEASADDAEADQLEQAAA